MQTGTVSFVGDAPGSRVERVAIPGACGECGAEALSRYPVLSEGGWYMVVKCGDCLASTLREPWRLYGHVRRGEDLA